MVDAKSCSFGTAFLLYAHMQKTLYALCHRAFFN